MRDRILGMTSHYLNNVDMPQFLEQVPELFVELMETHMMEFHVPPNSERFSRIGVLFVEVTGV